MFWLIINLPPASPIPPRRLGVAITWSHPLRVPTLLMAIWFNLNMVAVKEVILGQRGGHRFSQFSAININIIVWEWRDFSGDIMWNPIRGAVPAPYLTWTNHVSTWPDASSSDENQHASFNHEQPSLRQVTSTWNLQLKQTPLYHQCSVLLSCWILLRSCHITYEDECTDG